MLLRHGNVFKQSSTILGTVEQKRDKEKIMMWWVTVLSVIIFLLLLIEIDSNTRFTKKEQEDNEDIG